MWCNVLRGFYKLTYLLVLLECVMYEYVHADTSNQSCIEIFRKKTFLGYDCSYYVRFMGDVRPPIGKHMAWQTSTWGACCKIVNGREANHRYRCHVMKILLAQLEWKFVPHNIIWIQFTLTRKRLKVYKCWPSVD